MNNSKLILDAVNNKNANSWQILFDNYYSSLCAYVNRFINDHEITQDIVQEVFIGLWKSTQQFTDEKNLTYFLYRSCYNRSLNHIRNVKLQSDKLDKIEDKSSFENEDVYNETLKEEVVRLLYRNINQLPTQQKEILLLRLKGYGWNEVAEELNLSINTVKSHKKRAFQKLSEQMNVSELFIVVLFFSINLFQNH